MRRCAHASLPKSVYPREALVAAALALGRRGRVELASRGVRWRVEAIPEDGTSPARLLAEFLNDALSHSRRLARARRAGPLAAAVVSRLLARGFPAAPPDPLEELEPQVRRDRERETAALLAAAKGGR